MRGALLGLALLTACSSPGGNRVSGDTRFERAFLFPLNVVVAMPGELEPGAERVDAALGSYLAERGRSFETLPFSDARVAWLASVKACMAAASSGCKGFEGAAGVLTQRLRSAREFDVLILPYLLMRPVRVSGSRARWDGVERMLETGVEHMRGGDVWLLNNIAQAQGSSLALFVFSADGRKIFEGVGGLDLPYRIEIPREQPTADELRYRFVPVPDLFDEPQHLREGIAIAFDPLIERRSTELE